jgi:hypothetical protein
MKHLQEIKFSMLGECLEDEHYKVVVYALDDVPFLTDFEVKYKWNQNVSQKEADLIASACQGAAVIFRKKSSYFVNNHVDSNINYSCIYQK